MSQINLPDFSKAKVLVVGDLMLDRYWSGDSKRISPEAPIPVVKVDASEDRIGGAGNVALNLASLGVDVSLVAIVGDDEASQILEQKLNAAEVSCNLVKHKTAPTITKLRVMSRNQQMIRLDFEQAFEDEAIVNSLHSQFESLLQKQKPDVVIFSDYAKGTLSRVNDLISLCNQYAIKSLVDPKGKDFHKYQGAYLITPNAQEFIEVAGTFNSDAELEQQAKALLKDTGIEHILVTRSEKGMSLFQSASEVEQQHFPAHATEVFDVTGAGDTVIATLAAVLSAGESLEQAVILANRAAGIVVGKAGTAAISKHELEREVESEESTGGVLSLEQLSKVVKAAQAQSEKVVMTNGCFDIIHAGHIAYLQEAKRLGNRLIVAVNSDDSVKRLKGESRPINTLERRMQVLAGLQSVDWVVPFSEDTPAELVGHILPDILVKGGDWKVEEIAGGEAVVANGGKVMSLQFKEGHSTTAIIDLIKEREQAS